MNYTIDLNAAGNVQMKINLFESADLESFAPRRVQKLESLVSCGIPVVVAKQSAKPLAAVYPPFFRRSELGLNDVILQSLVIPFPMIVFHKLVNRPS